MYPYSSQHNPHPHVTLASSMGALPPHLQFPRCIIRVRIFATGCLLPPTVVVQFSSIISIVLIITIIPVIKHINILLVLNVTAMVTIILLILVLIILNICRSLTQIVIRLWRGKSEAITLQETYLTTSSPKSKSTHATQCGHTTYSVMKAPFMNLKC